MLDELVKKILEWWEEHEYDTCGDYGEYNVFDKEPEFVVLAKKYMKSQETEGGR
jgi:hypothetical protein